METNIDLSVLSGWMDQHHLGAGPIQDVVRLTGGTQNILLRFQRQGRSYVLRRPPPHLRKNSNETMRREARMLAALAGTPVPHPTLIAHCPDESVMGAAFYLMEPVDGFNPTIGLPQFHAQSAAVRHRMGLALVEGIAALGALDYRTLPLADFAAPANYLDRQVARWTAQLASYDDFANWTGPGEIPGVDQVAAWLDRNKPQTFEAGVIHGDYHLANVMYRPYSPELAAIVDWELTTIGDPLLDLGWVLATWPDGDTARPGSVSVQPWSGFPTADELVDHYRARTTRSLANIEWYAVLACFKLGIILEGTHARACANQAPRETGDRLHAQTIGLFERALRWIA